MPIRTANLIRMNTTAPSERARYSGACSFFPAAMTPPAPKPLKIGRGWEYSQSLTGVGVRSMLGRNQFNSKRAAIGTLVFVIYSGAAAAQGSPPPAVTVSPVASRQVTDTGSGFIGRVVAIDKVDVVARVAGFIEQRNFTEGQQVKTGDLLFRIEQDTYKAAVDQQAANLAKAKATEVNANQPRQRSQVLVKNQNVPQATVDQLEAAEQAAQADVLQGQALLEQRRSICATQKFTRRSTAASVS